MRVIFIVLYNLKIHMCHIHYFTVVLSTGKHYIAFLIFRHPKKVQNHRSRRDAVSSSEIDDDLLCSVPRVSRKKVYSCTYVCAALVVDVTDVI